MKDNCFNQGIYLQNGNFKIEGMYLEDSAGRCCNLLILYHIPNYKRSDKWNMLGSLCSVCQSWLVVVEYRSFFVQKLY